MGGGYVLPCLALVQGEMDYPLPLVRLRIRECAVSALTFVCDREAGSSEGPRREVFRIESGSEA